MKDSRGDRIEKRGDDKMSFCLRSQVRFRFPITAVLGSLLRIHGAPSRADHLEREIARRGWAAAYS